MAQDEACAEAFDDVAQNEIEAADFEAGEPFEAALAQGGLKGARDHVSGLQGDEGEIDTVFFKNLLGLGDAALLGDEESHGQAEELAGFDVGDGFFHECAEANVHFLCGEQGFDFLLTSVRECEVEAFHPAAHAPEQFWKVVALHDFGGGDAKAILTTATEAVCHLCEAAEEGGDEIIKCLTLPRELEGAALVQGDAEGVLELQDLGADGGLLNAVGHGPCGSADAAVTCHVVEEFEVMDVHAGERLYGLSMMPRGNIDFPCVAILRE